MLQRVWTLFYFPKLLLMLLRMLWLLLLLLLLCCCCCSVVAVLWWLLFFYALGWLITDTPEAKAWWTFNVCYVKSNKIPGQATMFTKAHKRHANPDDSQKWDCCHICKHLCVCEILYLQFHAPDQWSQLKQDRLCLASFPPHEQCPQRCFVTSQSRTCAFRLSVSTVRIAARFRLGNNHGFIKPWRTLRVH